MNGSIACEIHLQRLARRMTQWCNPRPAVTAEVAIPISRLCCHMTLTDGDDQLQQENIPTGPLQCTKEAVEMAIANRMLSPEQCIWLHTHHINWQIHVEGEALWKRTT